MNRSIFDRILVPLDGSALAEAILSQIHRILSRQDSEVLLVRAVSATRSAEMESIEVPEILQSQAARYLQEVAGRLESQGARVRSIVRLGSAAEVILDVASEERATLIALSTHGRSGVSRWTLGSVAEKVIRASGVPVLVMRSFAPAAPAFQRILVPVDTTDPSLEVVGPALELAQLFGSHVALLHVCDGLECSIPVPQLTCAFEKLKKGGVSVEPLMKQGEAALQILEGCREARADLIAMTTHGRSGFSRWMLGSVTEKVLRSATVPMLIVRPSPVRTGRRARNKERVSL